MKYENIVMFCQQNWDIGIATSAKNLAKEFSKTNRVLYVNICLVVTSDAAGDGQCEVKERRRVMR